MSWKFPWLAFMVLVAGLLVAPRGAAAADEGALVEDSASPMEEGADVPREDEEIPEAPLHWDVSEEERGGGEDSKEWDDVDTAGMMGLGGAVGLRLRGPPEHQDEQGEDHRWRRPKPPR